jgi:hypothetical protein
LTIFQQTELKLVEKAQNTVIPLVVCVIDIFGHDHDHDHEENI